MSSGIVPSNSYLYCLRGPLAKSTRAAVPRDLAALEPLERRMLRNDFGLVAWFEADRIGSLIA
jgi:hypothetical protein